MSRPVELSRDEFEALAQHPFVRDLTAAHLELLSGCAASMSFAAGEYMFREGQVADRVHLICEGRVCVELPRSAGELVRIQTIDAGGVVGWSWLFPPYQWHFQARVVQPCRTISLDGKCLLEICEQDNELGYRLVKRFAHVLFHRLQAARLQFLSLNDQLK